jgi:arylsulfatase B/arylsulfatase I/J
MQHGFVAGNDPWGLPLKHSLLPQYLKQAGKYQTHIVGKWHLGHFAKSRTPLERGFDSFYGYFTGFESYFEHIAESFICKEEHVCYADLRDDEEPVESKEYNAYLFMKQARAVIRNHGSMSATERTEHPLFLYYCLGNVHMPNEVPDKVMSAQDARLAHITYHERRVFGAMTTVLDDAVGEVVEDLKAQDMYDETVMVIASDNGAMSLKGSSGSNWPLRGMKGQSWEGGMRVHALVRSPSLPNEMRGTSYDGLFHVTDWLPTLIGGAIKRPDLVASENMDGVNHWHAMHTGSKAWPRTTIVHNIDLINLDTNSTYVSGAIRVGNYKLLVNVEPFAVVPVPNSNNADDFPTQTTGSPKNFLFDVTEDPGEHVNLIDDMPGVYNRLGEAFRKAAKGAVTPAYCGVADDDSATSLFDETGFVGPWRDDDVDYVKECITPDSDEDKRHIVAMYCAYRLLPMEECGEVEASSAS